MDLSILQAILPDAAAFLHVQPATLLFYLAFIVTSSNIATRVIPDDATGWRHNVRVVAAIVGMYVPNRVSSGITVNDVAKRVIGAEVDKPTSDAIQDAAAQPDALIPEVVDQPSEPPAPVVPAFPRFNPNIANGEAQPGE